MPKKIRDKVNDLLNSEEELANVIVKGWVQDQAGLQRRIFIFRNQRRLLSRRHSGGGRSRVGQLSSGPGPIAHRQLRGGNGKTGRLPGQRPEMGSPGQRNRIVRLGGRGEISFAEKTPFLRVFTRDRPPAPPDQHPWRSHARPQPIVPLDPPVFSGPGIPLSAHPHHHRQRLRRRRRDVSGHHPGPGSTSRRTMAKPTTARISLANEPGSPSADNWKARSMRWRFPISTPSDRPFGRKIPTPAGIWRSSG